MITIALSPKKHNRTKKTCIEQFVKWLVIFWNRPHFTLHFESTISNRVFFAFFMTFFSLSNIVKHIKTQSLASETISSRATKHYLLKLLKQQKRTKNKEEAKCFVRNDDELRWIYSRLCNLWNYWTHNRNRNREEYNKKTNTQITVP